MIRIYVMGLGPRKSPDSAHTGIEIQAKSLTTRHKASPSISAPQAQIYQPPRGAQSQRGTQSRTLTLGSLNVHTARGMHMVRRTSKISAYTPHLLRDQVTPSLFTIWFIFLLIPSDDLAIGGGSGVKSPGAFILQATPFKLDLK